MQPADRLVVQVEKSAENLALYLACLKVGGVYVPLNTAYTQAEVDYFINDAEPALFVGQSERVDVKTFTMGDNGQGTLLERVAAHSGTLCQSLSPGNLMIWLLFCIPPALLGALKELC